jgi:uncharacterized protein (DUF488 family)
MPYPLYTIGHSNHDIDAFIALLQQHGITALGDVRSSPYSRYLPHFCQKPLQSILEKVGIRYVFLGKELGARPDNLDCYVEGKALYERIAATEAFTSGLERVTKGIQKFNVALMCAEKDPINCHRAILVCRYLSQSAIPIHHILSTGELESHLQLEDRLLSLHGLGEEPDPPAKNNQLSLFNEEELDRLKGTLHSQTSPLPPRSREECLQAAYNLQGARIAYAEENDVSTD